MRKVIGQYTFSDEQRKLAKTLNPDSPTSQYAGELTGAMARKFTVDEFVQMAEAGVFDTDDLVELIDGVVVEMAPIGRPHGNRVSDVARAFWERVPREIRVYIGSTIRLNDQTGPQPDIALLTPESSRDESNVPRPEDILLIVEISASALRNDRDDKARRYAQGGIPELWILVVASDEIEVSRQPTPDGYANVQRYRRGDTLTIQALPDVRLTVDELLQ